MNWALKPRDRALWPVLFTLLAFACSRPSESGPDQHQIPFKDGQNAAADVRPHDPSSATNLRSDSNLPFDDSRDLPAGTLVTVRLKDAITADTPDFSGIFHAVIDEDVLVDGSTFLHHGASAAGRVESARASELKRNRSYVRLTLDSINLNGRDLPIHTSSLFVHGNLAGPESGGTAASPVVQLTIGRRLTFRLTEPVPLANLADTNFR